MHPLFLLLLLTLVLVIAFGVWNWMSLRRHQQTGGRTEGVGGAADPMSGTTEHPIRSGAEIRASLDAAAARRAQAG